MEALTPASADDLPLLGGMVADEPFWRYPWAMALKGGAHQRVWLPVLSPATWLASPKPGTRAPSPSPPGASGQSSPPRYGHSVVLLEHHLAPEFGEGMETLDLARFGADGSPHWSRIWPPRRTIPVMPGWNCGWPLTGTGSSAGRRARLTGARTRATNPELRRRVGH
jgi:hypothetical protein